MLIAGRLLHAFAISQVNETMALRITGTLLTQALDDLRSLADRCLPEILLASATTTLAPPKAASH